MAWIAARRPGLRYAVAVVIAYGMCWTDRRIFPLPADLQVHSAAQGILVMMGTSVKLIGMVLLWALLLLMLRRERLALRLSRRATAAADSGRSAAAA
jgi:hypothetical protein